MPRRPTRASHQLSLLVALLSSTALMALLIVPSHGSVEVVAAINAGPPPVPPTEDGLAGGGGPEVTAGTAAAPVAPPVVDRPPSTTDVAAPAPSSTRERTPRTATTAATSAPPGPDGRATTLGTGLWVADGQGPLRAISPDGGWTLLAWSPGSDRVAAALGDEVVLFEPGAGSRRQLLRRAGLVALRGAWSPDARSVAVLLSDRASGRTQVSVVDVATGSTADIPLLNPMTNLAYTPDGCLAFSDSIDGATGIALHCPGQPRRVLPLRIGALAASLGPLGFAYTEDGPNGISVVDPGGRPRPGISGSTSLYGNELAFDQRNGAIIWRGSQGGPTSRVELYASTPGGRTTTVTKCAASPPTVSTDGTLVYADACRTGPAVLLQRSAPSAPPQQVATIPYYRTATPLISPDSRWLVVALTPF